MIKLDEVADPNFNAQLAHWYEFRSRWHNLGALGTSPIVRLSILMPVAGYLILLNAKVLDYADIDPRFRIIGSDNPWRLVFFYFGTFSLGLASAIFSWRCHGVLKRHQSAVDFTNIEGEFFSIPAHISVIRDALVAAKTELTVWKKKKGFFDQLAAVTANYETIKRRQVEAMTMYWHVLDMSRTPSRIVCRLLYDVGLLALAFPTLVTFVGVVGYAIRTWVL